MAALRPLPRPRRRARRCVCADDPVAARARPPATAPSPTAPSADADYRIVDVVAGRGAQALHRRRTTATRSAQVALPLPGVHNARNATGAIAMAHRARASPFEAAGRGARPLRRGRPAASSSAASAGGVTLRRRLRPPARPRSPPCSTPPPAAATAGSGSSRVFQPHRYSRTAVLSPEFGDAFVDADLAVVTDIYPSGEAPRPGRHRQARRRRRARRPSLAARRLAAPARRPRRATWPASCGPATSASRWAAATWPSLPDEVLRPAGRRDAAGRDRDARRGAPVDAAAAVLGDLARPRRARSGRSPPTGSAGAAALVRRAPSRVDDLAARGRRRAASGRRPCSWSGGARTCSWPTPASTACVVMLGGAFAADDRASTGTDGARPGARVLLPGAGPPHRRGRADRLRVGGRRARLGRRRGAHERRRPRLGHGRRAGEGPRRRPRQRRGWRGGRRPRSTSRYRGSALGRPPGRGLRPSFELAPGDRAASEAEIAEIVRWRREHQPGGQNAGSVFINPSRSTLGRPAHRRARPARACASARPQVSDEARQLHPGRRGRLGRRRAGADDRGAAPGARAPRGIALRSRDPPGRLRRRTSRP